MDMGTSSHPYYIFLLYFHFNMQTSDFVWNFKPKKR